jgi:ribonuclease R
MARGHRGATSLVAEIVPSGRSCAARPAFERGIDIAISRKGRGDADIGDLVTVSLRGGGPRVVAIHGRASSPRAAMTALLASEGLNRPFPVAALEEAQAGMEIDGTKDAGRRDMREQLVLTIDPEGAKDHDDAIAVAVEGDDIRLWVHIADVARFVPPGGAIDKEAMRRGTSVYVPGAVVPMLPPRLSNDLCSLRPDVDRLAVTAEMLVDPDGEVGETRFYRSIIRSEMRLTYPQVDDHIAGAPLGTPELEESIVVARELSRRLRARRMGKGALEIASSEPVVRFDGDRIVSIAPEYQTESHQLIEDFMIAANEAVARFLLARKKPTVFRFHDDPEAIRVERLYEQLDSLDVVVPALPEPPMTPSQARQAVGDASAAVARFVEREKRGARAFPGLVLRSLKRAYYATDQVGHSGLGSAAYLHFTSPIRRYPDLMAHRALLDELGIGDPAPDPEWLQAAALQSSETEREAADVERMGDRICAAYLLKDTLRGSVADTVFTAEVTGIIEAGAFLVFGDVYEGFIPARIIPGDRYYIDDLGTALVGEATERKVRLGDTVEVRVSEVKRLLGRVSLEPAEGAVPRKPPPLRARAKGRSSRSR